MIIEECVLGENTYRMFILTSKPVKVSEQLYAFPVWVYDVPMRSGKLRIVLSQESNLLVFKSMMRCASSNIRHDIVRSFMRVENAGQGMPIPPVRFTIDDVKGSARAIVAQKTGYVALDWNR